MGTENLYDVSVKSVTWGITVDSLRATYQVHRLRAVEWEHGCEL
jgi:hypothetical protein